MSLAKKKERDEGMDYKKTAQEILNHVGGARTSFQRHIVRPDCAWLLQITRRQTKVRWRM